MFFHVKQMAHAVVYLHVSAKTGTMSWPGSRLPSVSDSLALPGNRRAAGRERGSGARCTTWRAEGVAEGGEGV